MIRAPAIELVRTSGRSKAHVARDPQEGDGVFRPRECDTMSGDRFIAAEAAQPPVALSDRVLDVSCSGSDAWRGWAGVSPGRRPAERAHRRHASDKPWHR